MARAAEGARAGVASCSKLEKGAKAGAGPTARGGSCSRGHGAPLLTMPPAAQPLQEEMPPWQCEDTGSRPGWGTGFLFDWKDLPNLKVCGREAAWLHAGC